MHLGRCNKTQVVDIEHTNSGVPSSINSSSTCRRHVAWFVGSRLVSTYVYHNWSTERRLAHMRPHSHKYRKLLSKWWSRVTTSMRANADIRCILQTDFYTFCKCWKEGVHPSDGPISVRSVEYRSVVDKYMRMIDRLRITSSEIWTDQTCRTDQYIITICGVHISGRQIYANDR